MTFNSHCLLIKQEEYIKVTVISIKQKALKKRSVLSIKKVETVCNKIRYYLVMEQ